MKGTQFYLEILDKDSRKNDLIDRFAINISDPFMVQANYTGIFGVATLEVSFKNCPTTETISPTVVTSTESDVTSTKSSKTTESGPTTVTSTESGKTEVTSIEKEQF